MLPKSVLLALVAALPTMTMAAALPAEDVPAELPAATFEGITWTGKIFRDDLEPTVLHGDADAIYNQIMALNPEYVASEVNPDPEEDVLAALSKRAQVRTCKVMATGYRNDLMEAESRLRSLGSNCGAPAKQCRRMTCQNTSATYICSEANDVSVKCNSLASLVQSIHQGCCTGRMDNNPEYPFGSGKSGHIYNDRVWSVWVGYGNCNHGSDSRPTQYPYPGGSNNGQCWEDK
ncbi:hypothetical protein QBC38DRAFT_66394 [Podospora fimiseda]|uniref:Secreted protein n=1 Tax=Podospora fimiseda TaxID=252190 RepID=A0AAN6YP42_9PEZI|nr:hypothetical protein QBC38DRAFT_66394 [Podospora fimiseda]